LSYYSENISNKITENYLEKFKDLVDIYTTIIAIIFEQIVKNVKLKRLIEVKKIFYSVKIKMFIYLIWLKLIRKWIKTMDKWT